nr:DNA topoisomerase 2 [Tanacetum cinerariifolium]
MQLGTRRRGGKDHDHADDTLFGTLLFTWLSPITQYLFPKDHELLDYLKEDDQSIEPACLIPIIPMVLVNGSEARGVWSSFIPNYNPRDIIANLKRLLEGKSVLAMLPCYRGFKGEIKKSASKEYTTYGIIDEDKDKDALTITELPVRCWTEDYKEFLEAASRGGKDIKDYKACNGDTSVHFEIIMTEDQMNKAREEGFPNKLKLTTTLSTANMYVLDAEGKLKKYDTPEKLLADFYRLRLDLYKKRKTSLLHELKIASLQLESKVRFAGEVWNGKLVLSRKRKHEKCVALREKGFKSLPSIKREAKVEPQEDENVAVIGYDGYDYLLSLPTGLFEPEYIEELEEERKAINKKIEYLTTSTPKSLWLKDLAALDEQLALENYPEAKYTKAEEEEEKRKKHEKCVALREKSFKSVPSIERESREEEPQKDEEDVAVEGYDGYDYLLSLPTESFEPKYIEELEEERKAKDKKIEHLTTSTTMKTIGSTKESTSKTSRRCSRTKREQEETMCIALGMCLISYLSCYPLMLFPECPAKVSAVAGWGN